MLRGQEERLGCSGFQLWRRMRHRAKETRRETYTYHQTRNNSGRHGDPYQTSPHWVEGFSSYRARVMAVRGGSGNVGLLGSLEELERTEERHVLCDICSHGRSALHANSPRQPRLAHFLRRARPAHSLFDSGPDTLQAFPQLLSQSSLIMSLHR